MQTSEEQCESTPFELPDLREPQQRMDLICVVVYFFWTVLNLFFRLLETIKHNI